MKFKLDLEMIDGSIKKWRQNPKYSFVKQNRDTLDALQLIFNNSVYGVYGSTTIELDQSIVARYNRQIPNLGE